MSQIVYDQSFEDYQKAEGINGSILNVVADSSLAHAKAVMDGLVESDSDALSFGRAFHALLLEGRQDFVIHPEVYPTDDKKTPFKKWSWNANYCKEWEAQQTKEVMSHAESDHIVSMVKSLRANSELEEFLKGGKCEVSLYSDKNGIKVKGRLDLLTVHGPIIDFKSTTNARPEKFVRQAYDAGYFLKAAFYLDLLALCGNRRKDFWFVAIEKAYPYSHSIIKLSDCPISFIEMGRRKYREALSKLLYAIQTNQWPDYGSIDGELAASPWMLKELEQS